MILDRDGSARDRLVERLLALEEQGAIHFVQPGTAYKQMLDPRTPSHVREVMSGQIFTLPTGLTPPEEDRRRRVLQVIRGNSTTGRHDADAAILFEAGKHACGYVITEDRRILRNRERLQDIMGPPLCIVTLAEFLLIYDSFVEEERQRDRQLAALRR
jgi:hypothetical protein